MKHAFKIYLILGALTVAVYAHSAFRGNRWLNYTSRNHWTHTEPGVHHK